MDTTELKQKLRQLKKLEARIRFKDNQIAANSKYIWNDFFSTKDEGDDSVKYSMKRLLGMDHRELKEVFGAYFYHVYFQFYKENGIIAKGVYDVSLLSNLGLPMDSSIKEIKSKFRELAKKYHPDLGGDSEKFIELIETYRKLTGDE